MTDVQAYIDRVDRYLQASGARRLDEARQYLADEVEFVFPYGTFHSLDGLLDTAGGRYRSIGKAYESWDVAQHPDGTVVVVSAGTLHVENAHGVGFDGVRYIDRLTFRDGRIVRHQVWNDLAESGVLERVD
jgi:ketosteroid isomerase-like protein